MSEPLFINKEEEKKDSQNFDYLRSEGIKYIQELTGAYWTDFNEHDPGVTILEQFCYALTDLSFRTDFEIKDHLFNDKNNDHSFLKPKEILPCNPLTINDYRKLIFDSIFEINNVWVQAVESKDNTINGLYKILLDVDEKLKASGKAKLINAIKEVFCDHRNICEDIEEVKILKPIHLSIYADVEIDDKEDIETILANMYFLCDQYLSPEIRFYSLEELLSEGMELDEIFNGPLLKHGFIKSDELFPKTDKVLISDITKIIMQVEGIVSVKNLFLKAGEQVFENQLNIAEDQIPKLVTNIKNDKKEDTIHFMKEMVNYGTVDIKVVKRKLNELKSVNKRVYRLTEADIELEKGEKIDVKEYYSIQNQFPVTYGIGESGIPNSPNTRRKGQAKQLKGFLLLFEQIIANQLSQLSHVKDLFSLKKNIEQSYYYQFLDNVPDVLPLYKNEKRYVSDPLMGERKIQEEYKKGLEELTKLNDNFVDRRNRFLDYLLALHGESFSQYSISQFNHYYTDNEFELHLIQSKLRLLKSLSSMNRNRARAFNYMKSSIGTGNITGMESRIAILMGLGVSGLMDTTEYKGHSLLGHYRSYGLTLIGEAAEEKRLKSWRTNGDIKKIGISIKEIEKKFDYVDDENVMLPKGDKRSLLLKVTLPFRSKTVPEFFLRAGTDNYNYRIAKYGDSYQIVFKDTINNTWLYIASCKKEEEAIGTVLALTNFLRELNIKSEGLHIIEHTLLRPSTEEVKHGIYLLDGEGNKFFRSIGLYSFEGRKAIIEKIKSEIKEYNNYSVQRRDDGDFEVHFKTKDNEIHFVSLAYRPSVEETHEKMEKLYDFLSDRHDIIPFENKVGLYMCYASGRLRIPEEFYSFRISTIFPSWTDRFHNDEFRSIIEDTVNAHCPANIASRNFWFTPENMDVFENIYYKWVEGMIPVEKEEENNNQFKYELSEYLFGLYDIVS